MRSSAAAVEPTLILWWHEAEHDELPNAYAVCWVEIVDEQEARSGLVRVSARTADPTDPYDTAVVVELHYQLERRLGALITVAPAIDRLELLNVQRRLAARGCRSATVTVNHPPDLLGGLTVTPAAGLLLAVVRANLTPNHRDRVLLWAEEQLEQLPLSELEHIDWHGVGWTQRRPGSWQLLATADRALCVAALK